MRTSLIDLMTTEDASEEPRSNRSPWRQRLVDGERGITQCFRMSSTLYFDFFAISILLCTAVVVELSLLTWAFVFLCVILILAGELIYDAILKLAIENRERLSNKTLEYLNVINAAVLVQILGSFLTIVFILGVRIVELDWF
ncbi:MAG TPA: hypothetical protein DD473_04095 [Planctomycetaceae bacterium]|nr:hypothetical protein [Planctomycetaceae bacterium]